jgi:thiosulfate sulfurtransferase
MAAAFLLLAPSAYQLNPAIPTRSCVRLSASDDEASGAAALDPRVAELAPPEAHERMQAGGARLLDVREPAAFALAHVPGALSVPAGEASPGGTFFRFHADFADHVAQLPATPDSALILACDAGAVSRVACGRLIDAGYGDVAVVRGGLDAWRAHEAGLPINLGAPPAAADDDVESEFGGEAEFIADDAWYAEGLRPAISAVAPADDDDADADLDELDDLDGLDLDDDEVRPARTARRDTHPPTLFSLGLSSPQMTALAAEVGVEVPTDPPHTPQVAETTAAAASALADTGGAAPPPPPEPKKAEPALDLSSLHEILLDDSTGSVSMTPSGSATPAAAAAAAERRKGPRKGKSPTRRTHGGLPPAWLVDVSQLDYPGMADRDELTKLSVKELKSFLFYRDASLSGSKQLLAERVEQAIRDEQEAGSGPLGAPGIGAPVSAAAATTRDFD